MPPAGVAYASKWKNKRLEDGREPVAPLRRKRQLDKTLYMAVEEAISRKERRSTGMEQGNVQDMSDVGVSSASALHSACPSSVEQSSVDHETGNNATDNALVLASSLHRQD